MSSRVTGWRRWALRQIGFPILNREMRERGLHLYRYVPETDRLVPIRSLGVGDLESTGELPSDQWYQALVRRNVRFPIAFDVGVNYGYTSAWLSSMADRVVTFEPNPNNQAMIREHLRIRRLPNVELKPMAVSNEHGAASLHVKRFDGHHSLADIGASATVDRIEVQVTTIERACQDMDIDRVDLLKVDVEGFEQEVFEGAEALLRSHRIGLILFEFTPHFYRQRGLDPWGPVDLLQRWGYRLTKLNGQPAPPRDPSLIQTDLFAEPTGRPHSH